MKQLEARFGQGVDGLKARWKEIVGEALARRTEPVKLSKPRGGGAASLELRVEGAAATLIQHQAPDILARVNLFLGEGAVERLRIVQGPLRGASPARPRPVFRRSPAAGRPSGRSRRAGPGAGDGDRARGAAAGGADAAGAGGPAPGSHMRRGQRLAARRRSDG